jgi:hypothetical protein
MSGTEQENIKGITPPLNKVLAKGNETGSNDISVNASRRIHTSNANPSDQFQINFTSSGFGADGISIDRNGGGNGGCLFLSETGSRIDLQKTGRNFSFEPGTNDVFRVSDSAFNPIIQLISGLHVFEGNITEQTLTGNRTWTFPDKTGTIAMLSDIPGGAGMKFIVENSESFSRAGQTTQGLINQQVDVYEDYLTINFTPTDTDNYIISSDFVWSLNSTFTDFLCRLSVENVTDAVTNIYRSLRMEPQDSNGGVGVLLDILGGGIILGQTQSGTNQTFDGSIRKSLELESGKEYNIRLQWASAGNNQEATIYEGDLIVEQKTLNP